MIDFSGKVALVTGGSRGIGAATVSGIVSAGGSVVVHYGSNRDAAEKTAADAGTDQCHLVGTDLNEAAAASGLWAAAIGWKGHIDILVNNAGVF